MVQQLLTPHQSQYIAWQLTRRAAKDSIESLASTLVDSQVDLNPHQVDAALFACRNPLSRGVILADEVGLGKTIEAGLVISQRWAERRRKILIIVPANLRKQWHQELQDKFGLQGLILEAKSYNALKKSTADKQEQRNPFLFESGPIICSYQFAKAKADDLRRIHWDLVVMDEAHRLRNVYKNGNVIARTIRDALEHVDAKVLLTATPLQNTLLELYGLVSMIDERVFGDLDSFRTQFSGVRTEQSNRALRERLTPLCKRTLRRQVQQYVPYTARIAIVEEFTPSQEEQQLSALVADYLRRPNLKALPEGQRQLISLVLWKLLASSSHAIAEGWSRTSLELSIRNRLHERQGQAVTNFGVRLPAPHSELAHEALKDPYLFDCLGLGDKAHEREIENALVRHITQFLLELGNGFAFVGRQFRLEVSDKEFFIDLLFYHTRLKCYVVVELKATEFKPEHAGQLNFYLTAVDRQVKAPDDNPTIGLLLCKTQDRLVAEYALHGIDKPIGVAEYELVRALPERLATSLPTVEELENELLIAQETKT